MLAAIGIHLWEKPLFLGALSHTIFIYILTYYATNNGKPEESRYFADIFTCNWIYFISWDDKCVDSEDRRHLKDNNGVRRRIFTLKMLSKSPKSVYLYVVLGSLVILALTGGRGSVLPFYLLFALLIFFLVWHYNFLRDKN